MYCCTTNYLKIQCPKTNTNIYHLTQILYIRIWGAAWLGWSSSSLSWIEITLSGGVVIIWRLDWGWRVYFQDGSLIRLSSWCWPPAGGLNSLPHGPLLLNYSWSLWLVLKSLLMAIPLLVIRDFIPMSFSLPLRNLIHKWNAYNAKRLQEIRIR